MGGFMKLIVFSIALALAQLAQADMVGYGFRNCQILSEERGSLNSSDVCIQKVKCEKYPLNDPESYNLVRKTAYCIPASSGRCPDKAETCLRDDNINENDIPKIKPLDSRPTIKPCDGGGEVRQGTATIVPLDSNGRPVPPARGSGGRQ
jgi:hypothetical protein